MTTLDSIGVAEPSEVNGEQSNSARGRDRWLATLGSPVSVVSLVTLLFALGVRLWLLPWRYFDADELLSVHGGWAIAHGQVIFRDFFETHPPALHLALAPLFWILRPDTSGSRATLLLLLARGMMLAATVGIVILTARVGAMWRNAQVGLLGAAMLSVIFAFQEKSIEIRPDVPASLLVILAVAMIIRATQSEGARNTEHRHLFTAGLLLGLALVFTTKLVFAIPGVAIAILLFGRGRFVPRERIARLIWLGVGGVIPVAALVAVLAATGALGGFYTDLVVLASRWPQLGLEEWLSLLIAGNGVIITLGAVGCHRVGARIFTGREVAPADVVLFWTAISIVCGLLVSPSSFFQYHLFYLPIWALFAASALSDFVDYVFTRMKPRPKIAGAHFLAIAIGSAFVWYVWVTLREQDLVPGTFTLTRHTWIALAEVAMAAVGAAVIARLGLSRASSLACAAAILIVLPAYHLVVWEGSSNRGQLEAIKYVIGHTSPNDRVLDGYSGAGAFRPQAFPSFLAIDVQTMISQEEQATFRRGLADGSIRPPIIVLDTPLRAFLGRPLVDQLKHEYKLVLRTPYAAPYDPLQEVLQRP